MPPTNGEQNGFLQLIETCNDYGQKALRAFNDRVSGEEFAQSVYTLEPELYQMIAGMGKLQIMTVLQSQPEVWAQIAPRAAEVELFVGQFIAYGQEQATDDEPEQPAVGGVS